jgi:multiple antibiotic resistance protein
VTLTEYTLLAFSALFVIVDPVAVIPAFLAMTALNAPAAQLRMARLACVVAGGVLILFAAAGKWIFRVLGITLPAFQIAGSILLLRIAMDMLYGRRSAAQETQEEVEAGTAKEDIAISPLGVPMLAGPGAISTSLILLNQARTLGQCAALFGCILAVCLLSYCILSLAVRGARRLSPLALKLVTRLMGLLLAAVAVQFALNGLAQAFPFGK